MPKIPTFLLGLLLLTLASNLEAAGIGGVWKSSTGTLVTIPPTQDFDIIFKMANGQKSYATGAWLPQKIGKQFTYSFNGRAAVCTVDLKNDNKITVESEGQITVWTREAILSNTPINNAPRR